MSGASVLLALAIGMGLTNWPAWIGDLASHFFVQYTLASVTLLVSAIWRRQRVSSLLVAACLLISGWMALAPWRDIADNNGVAAVGSTGKSIRLLYANVLSRNPMPRAIEAIIRRENPDVIVLVEPSAAFEDVIDALGTDYPFSIIDLRERNDGLAILSRLPASNKGLLRLESARGRIASMTITIDDGRSITVLGVHTHPPMSPAGWRQRDAELADIAGLIADGTGPTILAGDLNTTMWASTFRQFLALTSLRDVRKGRGILPTWPARLPGLLRLPIDQVLHSRDMRIEDVRISESIGSDHLPLIVDFKVR